nr:YDG domain-containing protein [Zavarzinia compransoris]
MGQRPGNRRHRLAPGRHFRFGGLRGTTALLPVAMAGIAAWVPGHAAFAQDGLAVPTGGAVVAGSAAIANSAAGKVVVDQGSERAVIDWKGFDVGAEATVRFNQPGAQSITVNRVTEGGASLIDGQVSANGRVVILNPNGVLIGAGGRIDAAGVVASTARIDTEGFMAGDATLKFLPGGNDSATVENRGTITAGEAGIVTLAGPNVKNSGTIAARAGRVNLAAGETYTLDLAGDGLVELAVTGAGRSLEQAGLVEGATVVMSADAAAGVVQNVVNVSGVVRATGIAQQGGVIVLDGGRGGVAVTGTLDASAPAGGGTGGAVTVTGKEIALAGAKIDASGAQGGGAVRIGGGRQGQGPLAPAEKLTVDAATTVKADAGTAGKGGDVVLWSDGTTIFQGLVSAKGGVRGGDGGEAEVSGKAWLDYAGFTDLTAAAGTTGNLLLDPYNIAIVADGTDSAWVRLMTDDNIPAQGTTVIKASTVITALGNANVTLSTGAAGSPGTDQGNITVDAALTWNTGQTLTLTAANAISINAPITIGGAGGLALNYNAADPMNLGFAAPVTYVAADGSALTASAGGTLSVNGSAYTLIYTMAQLDAIDATSGIDGTAITTYGAGLAGRYALARDLNAAGTTYTRSVVGTGGVPFTGIFEGLGHTIASLKIDSSNDYTGLFAAAFGGTLRDFGLTDVDIRGNVYTGAAAGSVSSGGAAVRVHVTGGTVTGASKSGGLAGTANGGTIVGSHASAAASGTQEVGGLVGYVSASGIVSTSYATGAVLGTGKVGGLAGDNTGTITRSHALGAVTTVGIGGGLVGVLQAGGTITESYSASTVTGNNTIGGLVGDANGAISKSYALGAVTGTGTGSTVGGLVGVLSAGGTITQSYAAGTVKGSILVGGLVGDSVGTITEAYAAGTVVGSTYVGGFLGRLSAGTITSGYYDTDRAGVAVAVGIGAATGVTGLARATFQNGSLPAGFNDSVWATASGLYPYLSVFYPNGARAVSGTAYDFSGALADKTITIVANGATVAQAVTDPKGYYYALTAANLLADGAAVFAYEAGTKAATAAKAGTAAAVGGVDLLNGHLTLSTTASTLDALPDAALTVATATAAVAGNAAATTVLDEVRTRIGYLSSAPVFTVGQAKTVAAGTALSVRVASGAITVGAAVTIENNAALGLYAGGTLALTAPITVKGTGSLGLGYNTADPANFKVAVPIAFTDAGGGAITADAGARLSINGKAYTLIYSLAELDAIDGVNAIDGTTVTAPTAGLAGYYALANTLDARGTTFTRALIGNTAAFTGSFTGLGRRIDGLTINAGTTANTGLFGTVTGGLVRDLTLNGGSIRGGNTTGGLIGAVGGTATVAYIASSAAVIGANSVGGIFGTVLSGSAVTATQLVAMGYVSGTANVGGLFGTMVAFTLSNAVFDRETAGVTTASPTLTAPGFGRTTAELQAGALFTGLDATVWSAQAGLYHSLKVSYPESTYAVTGTFLDALGAGMKAAEVAVVAGGVTIGSALTGANGYYYALAAGAAPAADTPILAYSSSPAAATLAAASGGLATTNVDLLAGNLATVTAATTLSAAPNTTTLPAAALAVAGSHAAALAAVNATKDSIALIATGASFTLDQNLSLTGGLTVKTASGSAATIAGTVDIENGASLKLLSGGSLTITGAIKVKGTGSLALGHATGVNNLRLAAPISFTAADGSAISASAGASLAINGSAYTLVFSMAELDAIDGVNAVDGTALTAHGAGLAGSYALAGDLVAVGTTYTRALIGTDTNRFTGTLEGLGHSITGLTINVGSSYYGGLIGGATAGAVVRDLALNGGSVRGNALTGALIGYATAGAVTVAYVFSSVAVTTASTGAGGLIGYSAGATLMITNSLVTGAVTSPVTVGAFVSSQNRGSVTITNSVFDSTTTGATRDNGSVAANSGQTTATLQAGVLPTGLDSTVWGTGAGLYPYLKAGNPDGVKAITGTVYAGLGTAVTSVIGVYAAAGGTLLGGGNSGVNGYYYIPVSASGFATGTAALVYSTTQGVTPATAAAGAVTAADLRAGYLSLTTDALTLAGLPDTAALSSVTSVASAVAALGVAKQNILLTATGASLTVTGPLDLSAKLTLRTGTGAPIALNGAVTVASGGGLSLLAGGTLALNAPITLRGAAGLVLGYDAAAVGNLAVAAPVTFVAADGSAIAARPDSGGGTLTVNGQAHTLIYSAAELAAISSGLAGNYALARDFAAPGTAYGAAVVTGVFTGNLFGLKHEITGLAIAGASNLGLFAEVQTGGVIRDLGLAGVSVTGVSNVGALAGKWVRGTLYNTTASGVVTGQSQVGGLIGFAATAAVGQTADFSRLGFSGAVTAANFAGGLIGAVNGLAAVSLTQSYAHAGVTASDSSAGGLVGAVGSLVTVRQSYAIGAVRGVQKVGGLIGEVSTTTGVTVAETFVSAAVGGGSAVGALIGSDAGADLSSNYFDTATAGITAGGPGVTGLTTAALQGGSLPAGFNSTVWSTGAGLYPYLTAAFPGGVQALTGIATLGAGPLASNATALQAVAVAGAAGYIGGTYTGANGYYYIVAPTGNLAAGAHYLAYSTSANAAVLGVAGSGGATGNVAFTANTLEVGAAALAAQASTTLNAVTAIGTASAAKAPGLPAFLAALPNVKLTAAGAFTLDAAINVTGTVSIAAGGNLTVAATGGVRSGGNATLSTTAAFINNAGAGAGAVSVTGAGSRWLVYSNTAAGDTFGGLDSGNTAVWNTAAGAAVSQAGNRYVFAEQPTLTFTAEDKSKVYGAAAVTLTYKVTGLSTGVTGAFAADTEATALSGTPVVASAGNTPAAAAGDYAITVTQGSLLALSGYKIAFGDAAKLTVTKAILTASLTGTASKVYDGTGGATLAAGNYSLAGVIGTDNVTLTPVTAGTYDTKNVGTGKVVTVTGLTLTGTAASNYTLASTTITGTIGTITAKALTASLTGTASKVYDGTTGATLTTGNFGLAGVLGTEAVTLTPVTTGTYDTKTVGTGKTVTVTGLTLTGTDAANYTLTSSTITGTIGTITAKALTASLTGTASKVYDGTTTATLTTGNFGLAGVLGTEAVSLTPVTTGTYDTKTVGTGKGVTVTGLTLTGSDAGNYTLPSTTVTGAIGTITAKALTASLTGTASKVYDGTTTATLTTGNFGLTGVLGTEAVSLTPVTTGTYDTKTVGTGKTVTVTGLTLTGTDAANYMLASTTVTGTIGTITAKALTASLTGRSGRSRRRP